MYLKFCQFKDYYDIMYASFMHMMVSLTQNRSNICYARCIQLGPLGALNKNVTPFQF